MSNHFRSVGRPPISRRAMLTITTGVAAAVLLDASARADARSFDVSPSPKLPGEYYRKPNQRTPSGTLFDNICVRINGDVARLHVPQTVKPGASTDVTWFYHGSGSDHNALDGGFAKPAAAVVDSGAVAICQTDGGTLYSHPTAQSLQVAGYAWISGIYKITANTLRATSGGGALANETYAGALIPKITGLYNVNAVYDISALYESGGPFADSVVAAFGNDPDAIAAANPARYSASAWAGKRLRIVVSQPNGSDEIVPPDQHGLSLLSVAAGTAGEASLRTHANGHSTPGLALPDFVAERNRWLHPVADGTAPSVAVIAPPAGSRVRGELVLSAGADDDVSVAAVTFSVAGHAVAARLDTAAIVVPGQSRALSWIARVDSSQLPNGRYTLTAKATDSSGNSVRSQSVDVTVAN